MNKRIENVMEGIDGVPDMALMSLPAIIIKEFKAELTALQEQLEAAETRAELAMERSANWGVLNDELKDEVTVLRKGEEKTKGVLHRQFAKVHKLQEGYEALRKERDEYREAIKKAYGLSVPEPINPHCIGCGFKDKILAAALSEELDAIRPETNFEPQAEQEAQDE